MFDFVYLNPAASLLRQPTSQHSDIQYINIKHGLNYDTVWLTVHCSGFVLTLGGAVKPFHG